MFFLSACEKVEDDMYKKNIFAETSVLNRGLLLVDFSNVVVIIVAGCCRLRPSLEYWLLVKRGGRQYPWQSGG
jgi:hypothetical protein